MAAGFGRKIFGANHQIRTAGAEAEEGAPAAKNAISAMRTFRIDISDHSVVDVQSISLASFDVQTPRNSSSWKNRASGKLRRS
jgi:protein-tyrosine-phosphatase